MATRKTAAAKTTAITNYDEELARQAQAAAAMEESTQTGQFFGLKGGILTFNDAPLPGNQFAGIILDSVLENVFFTGAYDPDTPQSPTCFAFGRDEKELVPHPNVDTEEGFERQCERCHGCEKNEFGSAEVGRGKACRNTRRLAIISGGTLNPKTDEFTPVDEAAIEAAVVGFMKLPVMSVKGYAAYVKNLAGALKKPPLAMFTKISVVPDPKSQFRVLFEALEPVPSELLPAILARVDEAKANIEQPYTPRSAEEDAPKPTKRGAKAQAPGSRARKY
jgi:hypothetical protein